MDQALLDRVSSDPAICGGRPCIRGTRIRVTDILDMLAAEVSWDTILQDFEQLERDDIVAALTFAARSQERPDCAPSSPR